jgi:hypothetical protein
MHRWQIDIFRAFDERQARFYLLNWHRRARKTTLGLNLLIREAYTHPGRVYGYIGPTYTQAKSIIWRDPNMLMRYLPDDLIARKNESELFVELKNGSIIAIKGADNADSIRGMDFAGVFLDEWALMKSMVWEEILRPIITQSNDRWAMFAFTPKGRNFVFDYWNKSDHWADWYRSFLPVYESDIMPKKELDKAKDEMPKGLYEQEFLCSFLADEENTLISAQSVEALASVHRTHREIRRVVACDPSQGGDECVIYVMENTAIIDVKVLHVKDTMVIAGEIAAIMHKTKTDYVAVDSIGIGAGICDRLRELGKKVIRINSSEKAGDEERFYNLRAEIWWYCMEQIIASKVAYPEDIELRRELSFVKYKVVNSSGKIQLEPKADTKERLGRSPDRADAFVYGVWGSRYANPVHKDEWSDDSRTDEVLAFAGSAMTA